jgi:hypothetical protein
MPIRLSLLLLTLSLLATSAWAGPEAETRQFLYSTPNTYGWEPVKGDNSYDFFKDGRLHVQGKDGEATMWEGTWKLKDDQLTLKIPALKFTHTYTVKIEGKTLLLDQQRYRRSAP